MQHFDRRVGIAAIAFSAAALFGCSAPPSPSPAATVPGSFDTITAAVVAPYRPPPKRAELPPPAPSPQALWQFGHWSWTGAQYLWTPGHYVERPAPTANWISDYWRQEQDGWLWVEGRWSSDSEPDSATRTISSPPGNSEVDQRQQGGGSGQASLDDLGPREPGNFVGVVPGDAFT